MNKDEIEMNKDKNLILIILYQEKKDKNTLGVSFYRLITDNGLYN